MISKERLVKEQQETGYRQEMIEKVVWLIHALNAIAEDTFLKNRLVLKGGTALNLFYFNLPRLSVDADLNYIGAIEKETMLVERLEIEDRIQKIFQSLGLNLLRSPHLHAGGKMVWRYKSALGNLGTIELDLNYMYRVPLLPTVMKSSVMLAQQQVKELLLLDIHELASGKLVALIDRGTGRDLFDAYHLFQHESIEMTKLRLCFVIYAAMNTRKNFIEMNTTDILVDKNDFQNKLIPVLNHNSKSTKSISEWIQMLTESVQSNFSQLLPLRNNEKLFIQEIHQNGEIKPDLITNDTDLIQRIKLHPGLWWAGLQNK